MHIKNQNLLVLFEPEITAMGFELLGIELIKNDLLKPVVHTKLPLKDLLIGFGWMQENKLFGRVVFAD